jgi:hypothetical protein
VDGKARQTAAAELRRRRSFMLMIPDEMASLNPASAASVE